MTDQGIGARLAAQGGRPLHARPRAVCRRHPAAGHAGGGVPAQPAGACAHQRRSASRRRSATACSSPRTSRASPPIRADTRCPASSPPLQPILATGKVRYVGELVAMCVAPTRAEAEDLAAEIEVDFEPLPAVADMLAGAQARRAAGARALGRQPIPHHAPSTSTSRPSKPRPPCRSRASCAPRARP